MGNFRISLGAASCKVRDQLGSLEQIVCNQVFAKMDLLRSLSASQLSSLPEQSAEQLFADGRKVVLTIFKVDGKNGGTLFVIQAFLPTFRFPNYFSFNGVGKMFVEGLVLKDGLFRSALDEELWGFR